MEQGRNHSRRTAGSAPGGAAPARNRSVPHGFGWPCMRSANRLAQTGRLAAGPARRSIDTRGSRRAAAAAAAARGARLPCKTAWQTLRLALLTAWLDVRCRRYGCTRSGQYTVQRRTELNPACPSAGRPGDQQQVDTRCQPVEACPDRLPEAAAYAIADHRVADPTAHREPDPYAAEVIRYDVQHQQRVRPTARRLFSGMPEIGARAQPLVALH
jgi:hypothetical protein